VSRDVTALLNTSVIQRLWAVADNERMNKLSAAGIQFVMVKCVWYSSQLQYLLFFVPGNLNSLNTSVLYIQIILVGALPVWRTNEHKAPRTRSELRWQKLSGQ